MVPELRPWAGKVDDLRDLMDETHYGDLVDPLMFGQLPRWMGVVQKDTAAVSAYYKRMVRRQVGVR